ncbi:hypothetical protein BKA66DRAFT_445702 [Pyrenochaeta sp. MPI-SDFR-AT-0127]|nr:hypothetical protein BKA66DRAFT_445702 [Pyrenochaeta sp. MPI-SDFR-AT-0127]
MLYLNKPLEDCVINYIKIELAKHLRRTAQQISWQRRGPQLLLSTTWYHKMPINGLAKTGKSNWAWAAEQNLFQFVISNNTKVAAMWSYRWLDTALKTEKANLAEKEEDGNRWQSGSISLVARLVWLMSLADNQ